MKKIRKYNESNESDNFFDTVSDIFIELKDEYPRVKGNILQFDTEKDPQIVNWGTSTGKIAYIIELTGCDEIKFNSTYDSIEFCQSKVEFINLILELTQRVEAASGLKAKLPKLFEFDHWQNSPLRIQFITLN